MRDQQAEQERQPADRLAAHVRLEEEPERPERTGQSEVVILDHEAPALIRLDPTRAFAAAAGATSRSR